MREKNLQSFLAFLGPWLIIFIIGFIVKDQSPSIFYYNLGLGISSFFTLILLWYSSTGKMAHSSTSVLISMVAISLKMFASAIIFIYYFHTHHGNVHTPLSVGALLFFIYTTFEVYIGLKYSKNIS